MAAPGIYLHLPFCSAICPYCDFAVTVGGAGRRRRFVDLLEAEIELIAADPWRGVARPPADTVYLGGGTPSLLEPDALAQILGAVRRRLGLATEPRISLEANPEDVNSDSCAAWRRLGVSFLSLGVQSFDPARLAFLGRRHTAAEARQAVSTALDAGFATVSVDLIYGVPGQTVELWRRDLDAAVAAAPHHISCYQLTVEPRTPFAALRRRGRLRELGEPVQAELFRTTHETLAGHGYPAYEVSNFATAPRHRSPHNAKYWGHVPYLGLGPSAHSFDGRRRWWNERDLGGWSRALRQGSRPLAGEERLNAGQVALEELMLALRTPAGIDLEGFRRRHGVDLLETNGDACRGLVSAGLVEIRAGRLAPTLGGLAVADGLAASLTLDEGRSPRPLSRSRGSTAPPGQPRPGAPSYPPPVAAGRSASISARSRASDPSSA